MKKKKRKNEALQDNRFIEREQDRDYEIWRRKEIWWIHRDALEDLSFRHFLLLSHQLRGITLTRKCNRLCLFFFRVCVLINKTQVLFIVNRLECSGSYFIQLAVFLSCFYFHRWNRNTLYIHCTQHNCEEKKKAHTLQTTATMTTTTMNGDVWSQRQPRRPETIAFICALYRYMVQI